MAINKSQKIKFLQDYVKAWHKNLSKKHPENIVAIRIGKKITKGKETRNYSIIVQVAKKLDESILKPSFVIPKEIEIEFPDKKKRKIKTDIEESGKFKFQLGITSEVQSKYSIHFGTAGLFVSDNSNKVYMLTNYHVVAEYFINAGKFRYKRPANQTKSDVKITDRTGRSILGRFEIGIMSHEIDAAFVEIPVVPNPRLNILPDGKRVQGRVAVRPLPSSIKGNSIIIYSYYNPTGENSFISDNSTLLRTNDPQIFFEDIIQIRPKITQGGDSGGIVLTTTFAVLGIVVGGDDLSSYAIPFYKIDDFKNINIL